MSDFWKNYDSKSTFDGYISKEKKLRSHAKIIAGILEKYGKKKLQEIEKNCQSTISARGINFRVYAANNRAEEKKWPLDIIPRIIPKSQWLKVAKGLAQRVKALNLFIDDVYNAKKIFKDKVIPKELIFNSPLYLKDCEGFSPKHKAWSNISGIDLIKNIDGDFLVLEDNLRVPSGVSYMLENRMVMRDIFPELFTRYKVSSVHQYANKLYNCMTECIPKKTNNPHMVLLTPGIYNSAYFEHSFLAEQMGIALVEGKDLFIDNEIQVAESDEHLYSSTFVNSGLNLNSNKEKAAIIGGGDGGVARECISQNFGFIDWYELDPEVVDVCDKHLSKIGEKSTEKNSVKCVWGDAFESIKSVKDNTYDQIFVDLNDDQFCIDLAAKNMSSLERILKPKGVITAQVGSQDKKPKQVENWLNVFNKNFGNTKLSRVYIPSFDCSWNFSSSINH